MSLTALSRIACLVALALITLGWVSFANAQSADTATQNSDVVDMPVVTKGAPTDSGETHPTLNLMPDKSELIKLDKEAASVIVGNPNHISVMLDTPDTLIVVPRASGASHFTVMGKDGTIIMQRHVIVGAPKEQYVRIHRSCNGSSSGSGRNSCEEISTYYCPDSCHEVTENNTNNRRF